VSPCIFDAQDATPSGTWTILCPVRDDQEWPKVDTETLHGAPRSRARLAMVRWEPGFI